MMEKNVANIGSRENEFLITFAGTGKNFFTFAEALSFWGSHHNTRIALHRLARKGLLKQIEKGKYLIIPLEAGTDRKWSEDSYVIASQLVEPAAIAYWTAIKHWNWTEQIPRIVYVQTTSRKSRQRREVFGVVYEFVTVNKRKFYGHTKEWRGARQILVTDKEKTLVDCADDVERAGTIEELSKAVKAASSEISWRKLNDYVQRFPNGAVKKRLGFLFERLGQSTSEESAKVLTSWRKTLSAGIVPLEAGGRTTGRIVRNWSIRINAHIE